MIEATIICDSVSPQGKRLTTFKLRYPKFIHGEFMTHRVISRNASSSRAVPTKKLLEEVRSDALRAAPVFWGRNQSGMQAAEELSDDGNPDSPREYAKALWADAAECAANIAGQMAAIGVHKQIVNRLLEPFSHINVVATATEWDNFFGLRLHKDAQPEMRALAIAMWEAYKASEPDELLPGDWHLPFVESEDYRVMGEEDGFICIGGNALLWKPVKVSVARCARVSYESFETGKRSTVEEDLKLYDKLLGPAHTAYASDGQYGGPLHASPAEHQATPDEDNWIKTDDGMVFPMWKRMQEHGNFVGWRQYRKMLPGEAVAPMPEEFR